MATHGPGAACGPVTARGRSLRRTAAGTGLQAAGLDVGTSGSVSRAARHAGAAHAGGGGSWSTAAAPGPQARARFSGTERRPVTRSVSGRSGRSRAEGGTLAHCVAPRPQALARGRVWYRAGACRAQRVTRERGLRAGEGGALVSSDGGVSARVRPATKPAAPKGRPPAWLRGVWWSWLQSRAACLRLAAGGWCG